MQARLAVVASNGDVENVFMSKMPFVSSLNSKHFHKLYDDALLVHQKFEYQFKAILARHMGGA